MSEQLLTNLLVTIPNVTSIVACTLFFHYYAQLGEKTLGLKMIRTLSISDFIYHTSTLILTWSPIYVIELLSSIVVSSALRFCVFWASTIAYFLYRLFKINEEFNPFEHYYTSMSLLILLSCSLALISELIDEKLNTVTVSILTGGLLVSIGLTTYFYMKTIRELRRYSNSSPIASTETRKILFGYAIVQLITFTPKIIYSFISTLTSTRSDVIESLVNVFVGLSGFSNAMIFFFKRVTIEKYTRSRKESFETEIIGSNNIERTLTIDTIGGL